MPVTFFFLVLFFNKWFGNAEAHAAGLYSQGVREEAVIIEMFSHTKIEE